MKKRRILIFVIIILLAGAGTFYYFRFQKKTAAVTYQTAQATKGTLISTVSGSGNIVVASSSNIKPSITGTVANVKVGVGDQVTKGQTLFTITNADLDVSVGKAYTTLLQAQQKLTQAQSTLTTDKQNYTDTKNHAVTQAQLAYNQAQQDLAQAESQLEQDQSTLAKFQKENTQNAGTHSDAELNVTEQKIAVDKTTITAKTSDATTAKSNLTKAKAGASSDIVEAKAKVDSDTISIQAAQNDVNSAQLDYDNQKKSADERTVTAPIAGTVTTINVANGDQLGSSTAANSSSSSASNSATMVIEDLTSLKATVQINEVDIASVKVDQKASMTFDAISGLTLTGKVEKVDTIGTSTQGVVSYLATIGFDSLDARVRPEMSANATITTDVKQDVIIVPSSAVKTQNSSHYVEVLQNGSPAQQTVEIGATNDTQTEITSGISEGTSVVTQTITANSSSTSSNTNSSRSTRGGFGGPGAIMFGD